MPNKTPNQDENAPVLKRSQRLRSKKSDSDNDQSGTMSLDVLAHVASETLRTDTRSPGSNDSSPQKKVSLRNLGGLNTLTLHQILGLTERTIMNLFTESTSNELSRTFTYSCQLMPKVCRKQCSSFGSEMKARAEMKKHIYDHLNELEKESHTSKTKFTAETVQSRNRRLQALISPKRLPAKKKKISEAEKIRTKVMNDTILISDPCLNKTKSSVGFIPDPDKLHIMDVPHERFNTGSEENASDTAEFDNYVEKVASQAKVGGNNNNKKKSDKDDLDSEERHKIEENEQFIIELLSKTQPHHDHSYTTIFGQRTNSKYVENLLNQIDGAEYTEKNWIDELNLPSDIKKLTFFISDETSSGKRKRPAPILFLRHRSPDENVPMVSAEEIIEDPNITRDTGNVEKINIDEEIEKTTGIINISSGEKPYPPMPKSILAKKGRLGFDIHDLTADDDEYSRMRKRNPLSREGREGNLGWEPKLALKLIKELKGRRRDEVPLKCKICNDKVFTATATLMYHYRSHAGIKPFVCLICNTTFTRQHSLNYHMLIHNNQSRFTCKDCGRKFRHPSHFKEHLRRHTGETPFNCSDCGMKFKTRNTYKRHLKTRHGKLLTATGISLMSEKEFAKVRTRRYQIPELPEIGYQMPELKFTKLKQLQEAGEVDVTESIDESVILEELKADIKKESESGNESDPELVDILEALQQTTPATSNGQTETVIKKEPGLEPMETTTTTETKSGIYVNNINKEIGEALLGINV